MNSKLRLVVIPCALALATLAGLAVPSGAVIPGENGRIVFVSGRSSTDAVAEIFLLPVPGSTGGGTLSPPIATGGGQHRHPTWSPDRTKIAYARGDSATANFDIFVQDLTDPGSTPRNITNSTGVTDDRPSWSPDGTRIAWESEVTDGSNQTDVLIRPVEGGATTNFTNTTTAGQFEGKPVWTPNSSTLLYQKGNPNAATNANIVRKPVAGGTETLAVADSGISEFQPSISPDGTRVCFTLSNNGFNATADVLVAPLTTPPSGGIVVSRDLTGGDYNCAFSPDGFFVAYVNGIFGTGQLVMVRADNTSLFAVPLAQDANANRFDGNPEWAPDGRPVCPDENVVTGRDTPITFVLTCRDTGPLYERSEVREFAGSQPASGTLTQELAGDPFSFTPAPGFTGTVSFEVRSFDGLGFGTDAGTVTIEVRPPGEPVFECAGQIATLLGSDASDLIDGTPGRDVIVARGGADRVRAGRGRDIVCGDAGNDSLGGGSGNDRIGGGGGADRANGQSGNDRVGGNSGSDRVLGGRGRDRLSGAGGRDRLGGGTGRDRLNGGSGRDRCDGGPGADRAARCDITSRIP